jgi:mRNA guanylyltransferase
VLDSIDHPVTEQDLLAQESKIKEAVKRLREEEKRRRQGYVQQQQQQQQGLPQHDAKKRKFSEANAAH